MSDDIDDDEFDEENEHEPMRLMFTKDGKLGLAPETIELDIDSFNKLKKGLDLLKKKYPKISKECFPE